MLCPLFCCVLGVRRLGVGHGAGRARWLRALLTYVLSSLFTLIAKWALLHTSPSLKFLSDHQHVWRPQNAQNAQRMSYTVISEPQSNSMQRAICCSRCVEVAFPTDVESGIASSLSSGARCEDSMWPQWQPRQMALQTLVCRRGRPDSRRDNAEPGNLRQNYFFRGQANRITCNQNRIACNPKPQSVCRNLPPRPLHVTGNDLGPRQTGAVSHSRRPIAENTP